MRCSPLDLARGGKNCRDNAEACFETFLKLSAMHKLLLRVFCCCMLCKNRVYAIYLFCEIDVYSLIGPSMYKAHARGWKGYLLVEAEDVCRAR